MRSLLICLLLSIKFISNAQSCAPGGTVFASISGTMSLCPPPPSFVLMLNYEVCAGGKVMDTCGGNATRYYFINIGGEVTLKAFQNASIQVKTGGKLNITGGANLIYVEAQPGAILTGIPPGTLTTCSALPPPNGATCYVSNITSQTNKENNITVYPNPFTDKISISSEKNSVILIFNSLGQLVYKGLSENERTEIDLRKEPKGIYFIRIGSTIKKLIKD